MDKVKSIWTCLTRTAICQIYISISMYIITTTLKCFYFPAYNMEYEVY